MISVGLRSFATWTWWKRHVLNEPWKKLSMFLAKEPIRGSRFVAALDDVVVKDTQHTKLSRRDFSQTVMTQ